MKIIHVLALTCGYASLTFAQSPGTTPVNTEAAEKPVCPPGPLIKHAEPFSKWTISYQYKDATEAAKNGKSTPGAPADSRPKLVTVVKTLPMIFEETIDQSGAKTQHWADQSAGMQITIKPKATGLIESVPGFYKDPNYIDYSAGDFQGFGWISANFVGIQKYVGHDCMIFRKSGEQKTGVTDKKSLPKVSRNPGEIHEEVVDDDSKDTLALIDVDTRMPVFLQSGDEKRSYAFVDAPNEVQVPPPEIQARFTTHKEDASEAARRPVRPF